MSKKEEAGCRNAIFDQPGGLMKKTLEMLRGRDLIEVSAETKLSFYWLKKFEAGTYKNPSVNRVQYLYEHLMGTKLI